MSGILLPGQENQPPQDDDGNAGGGLILPSGYESKQAPKPVESIPVDDPSAPDAAASAQASGEQPEGADNASPQAEAGQPQLDIKYPPSGAQVQCPNCGASYTTPVFTIIDLGADPALKSPLLGGQINMAMCQSCGAAGQLSVPLMIHVPEEEFLGVFVPQGGGINDVESQRVIGNLTQQIMRDLPQEDRKGYMLQPQQFFDWNRMVEKLWGFEGVTPEMLRRQSEQSNLVQSLLRIGNDDGALQIAADRNKELIDRDFFTIIEQMAMSMSAQGQNQAAQGLMVMHEKLIGMTDTGKEILEQRERVQAVVEQITPETSREDLLQLMIDSWATEDGEQVVSTLTMAMGPALDYDFLMQLTQKIDSTSTDEEKQSLEEMRELILEIQQQQKQSQQAAIQQMQAVLQEILQAEDTEAELRKYAAAIDENFLGILAANIQSAQESNAAAAVQRLTAVYNQAMAIFQEKLPPEVRFLQNLMATPDQAAAKKMLQDNRQMLTKDLLETMATLEGQMRDAERTEQADKLKSLRSQASLML